MELLENRVWAASVDVADKHFESLYEKAFVAFARFASNRKTSYEDAKDIFHDAMVIYLEKSSHRGLTIHTSPEGYVVGIAKHLWSRKFRHDQQEVSLDEQHAISIPADFFPEQKEVSLLDFLERTGQKCMDLLQKFYFERASLREIATFLGYRTEHSAAVQKFKCIGKLRDFIKAKDLKYEDFPH